MSDRDDLVLILNNKIMGLSNDINDKINNAAIQTKTVLDLGSAIRSHLQKILEIANSSADPVSVLSTVKSTVQNLFYAIQGEEGRVKNNYESLVARKQALHDITTMLNETINTHQEQHKEFQEVQQKFPELKNPERVPVQRLESAQKIRDVKKDLLAENSGTGVESRELNNDTQDVSGASSVAGHIYNVAGTQDDPEVGEEIPTHVSRFFKG